MKNLKSKKKGFTLVELLAVIAILAIIGAVLIPNLMGFKEKAHKSNIQASAKAIVSTAKNYLAESEVDLLADGTITFKEARGGDGEETDFGKMLDLSTLKKRDAEVLDQVPMNQMKNLANGNFTVESINSGQDKGKIKLIVSGEEYLSESNAD